MGVGLCLLLPAWGPKAQEMLGKAKAIGTEQGNRSKDEDPEDHGLKEPYLKMWDRKPEPAAQRSEGWCWVNERAWEGGRTH